MCLHLCHQEWRPNCSRLIERTCELSKTKSGRPLLAHSYAVISPHVVMNQYCSWTCDWHHSDPVWSKGTARDATVMRPQICEQSWRHLTMSPILCSAAYKEACTSLDEGILLRRIKSVAFENNVGKTKDTKSLKNPMHLLKFANLARSQPSPPWTQLAPSKRPSNSCTRCPKRQRRWVVLACCRQASDHQLRVDNWRRWEGWCNLLCHFDSWTHRWVEWTYWPLNSDITKNSKRTTVSSLSPFH